MFFIKFIRFCLGYVTFIASDGFSERFINLCSQKGIALWDVESRGGVIHASTNIKGYKQIRSCARPSSMRVRIKEKHGIPFLVFKNRIRIGFLIGAVMFLIIIGFLSTRLWTIEVKGNDKVTDKEIIQTFEELGVSEGAKISKIDVTSVTEKALENMRDISWLALNISGSKATIEVRESIKKPKIEEKTPCNIVAAYGGQIVKLEVYEGQAQQELGAAVAKGDLIISGVVENKDNTSTLKHARGIVLARTDRNLSESHSKNAVKLVQVKEKKRIRILFFGLDIPLLWLQNGGKNSQYYIHESRLSLYGNILPVGFIREGYKIYEEKEITFDDDNCMLLAFEKFSSLQREEFSKIKILNEEVETINEKDGSLIKGKYTCEENIGKSQEIFIEN